MRSLTKVRGMATVEFAVVGSVFFLLMFGLFEVGRTLFVWNTLTEATRRGARMAVVCPVSHPAIAQIAVFNAAGEEGQSRIINTLAPEDIEVSYLDADGNLLTSPAIQQASIRFARVAIKPGQPFPLMLPGLGLSVNLPAFRTTLPVESLGISRDSSQPQCDGIVS